MYNLEAFSLNLSCDFPIPELLIPDDEKSYEPDATITSRPILDSDFSDFTFAKKFVRANDNQLLIDWPIIGRFLIKNGNEILVEKAKDCSIDVIQNHLLGTVMAVLMMQRNLTILHANAIKIGENCVSFSGHSGSGKSVISAAFFQRGYSVLTDDMCVIDQDLNVMPGLPRIKIKDSSCSKLGINPTNFAKVNKDHEKRLIPLDNQFYPKKLTLKLLYILDTHAKATFEFNEMEGSVKIKALDIFSHLPGYRKAMNKDKAGFKLLGEIASDIRVVRISRPASGFDINELMNAIEEDLATRGFSTGSIKTLQSKKSLETEYES